MALIIKGDMPKGCESCPMTYISYHNDDEQFCIFYSVMDDISELTDTRHPACSIIGEIPDKHGDLIDRDKASTQIIAEICQFCANAENGNCDGCLVQKCLEAIGRVPTIVEATE